MKHRMISKALSHKETLVRHRRFIHEHAEVHNELPITTQYVISELKAMGYEPEEICQSGIVALAGKRKGKTFLLRADMDALPMVEENTLHFKSKTGHMHACGHDMHTAMLLGAARLLKEHEEELDGQVKLMFQPAEETLHGAKSMIEAGVLKNPSVDAAMMIHVMSGMPLPSGSVLVPQGGVLSAAADWFKISVQGKGGHGAMPNTTVDPLNVISHIHIGLQEILSREVAPGDNVALTIGQMHGGATSNVIPDMAYLAGTARTFGEETRSYVRQRIEEIASGVSNTYRASANVVFERGCPSVVVDQKLRDQVYIFASDLVATDRLIDPAAIGFTKMSGSEDFAHVSMEVPSIMVSLAAGSPEENYTFPMHHPKVMFDEEALHVGAALYAHVAMEWLKHNK